MSSSNEIIHEDKQECLPKGLAEIQGFFFQALSMGVLQCSMKSA